MPTKCSTANQRSSIPDDEEPTDLNTIVFSLVVKCERNRAVRPAERDINKLYHNTHGATLVHYLRCTP